jgi:hypothetical protein
VRPEEKWAADCISGTLGVEVVENDDGTEDSMYDLRILYTARPHGAVEVTAAADQDWMRTGSFSQDKWTLPNLVGGWMVGLLPTADLKRVRSDLPLLLEALEGQGVIDVQAERWWEPGPYKEVLHAIGISHVHQSETSYPGSVYFIPENDSSRMGGMVPTDGRPLLDWIAEWVARTDKADNLLKLASSGADERHLFLILPAFADPPFDVVDLLMRDDSPLPDSPPNLPDEITHLWALSVWNSSGTGMRWDPHVGWSRFDKA